MWAVAGHGARKQRDHVLMCVRRTLCEELENFQLDVQKSKELMAKQGLLFGQDLGVRQ